MTTPFVPSALDVLALYRPRVEAAARQGLKSASAYLYIGDPGATELTPGIAIDMLVPPWIEASPVDVLQLLAEALAKDSGPLAAMPPPAWVCFAAEGYVAKLDHATAAAHGEESIPERGELAERFEMGMQGVEEGVFAHVVTSAGKSEFAQQSYTRQGRSGRKLAWDPPMDIDTGWDLAGRVPEALAVIAGAASWLP